MFHSVVQCSLALANCSSAQGRNTGKARDWVQTQLRRVTTPTLKNSNLFEIGEYWGYTAQEATEIMLDKVNVNLNRACIQHSFLDLSSQASISLFWLFNSIWKVSPITVNFLYCGHPWDRELVSLIARVRDSGNLFQSNVCNVFLPGI